MLLKIKRLLSLSVYQICQKVFRRLFQLILKTISSFLIILKNVLYIPLFIYVVYNKLNVFEVSRHAIGHYPVDLHLSKQKWGHKNFYFYKRNHKRNINEYLDNKLEQIFHFDPCSPHYRYLLAMTPAHRRLLRLPTWRVGFLATMPQSQNHYLYRVRHLPHNL